jgi:Uma2 family endonuclease
METPYHDVIEEYQSEDIMSVNHSKLIHRLSVALNRYEDQYDILPELELDLTTGKCKPDISIFPKLPDDWENDIIFYAKPPIIAIEIQSPKQATADITSKINAVYFPAGVQSVWIVVPPLQMVQIRTGDGQKITYTHGVIKDPVTGFDVHFDQLFR